MSESVFCRLDLTSLILEPELHATNASFIGTLVDELSYERILETLEMWESVGSIDEDLM